MGRLKELNDDINKIITLISKDQDLCKLLTIYDKSNVLEQPDINNTLIELNNKEVISTNRHFPISEKADVKLNIIIGKLKPSKGGYFKFNNITFEILVHNDLWDVKDGIRALYIADRLEYILSNNRELSIGELEFSDGDFITKTELFQGYYISFKAVNFSGYR
ncbi:hypothetical protein K144316041_p20280 (plasmid) [Clostridium tetani]|uniref:hypothetical protein n=1 Tax=Clostridium tetani TaxID=1513 RepID=UPI0029534340|nr:hypothetical protein [Clostridium tetani]BDR74189.1 hypothetical protein K144316041_p20280 [Clostridium tetani]